MLDQDAEESGPEVMTTLAPKGKHVIDLAGDIEVTQELDDGNATYLEHEKRVSMQGSVAIIELLNEAT